MSEGRVERPSFVEKLGARQSDLGASLDVMEGSSENVATDQPAEQNFADRLVRAVEQKRSQLVVGLDPRLELLPLELRG